MERRGIEDSFGSMWRHAVPVIVMIVPWSLNFPFRGPDSRRIPGHMAVISAES